VKTITATVAKRVSKPRTGRFALLGSLLRGEGSGAPGTGHRVVLSALLITLGALLFSAAPALAAVPETPTVTVESITSTTATFHGTLQPAAPGEPGLYKFLYKAGSTCTGGSETAPEISMGGEAEQVFEPVSSLIANTEYTVCVVVRNDEFVPKEAVSAPFTFKTELTPETPETLSPAKSITATTATLGGVLNPNATVAAEDGWYFAYSNQGGSSCTEGPATTAVSPAENGAVKNEKVEAPLGGLEPNTKYVFCLVATNAASETTVGNEVPFETSKAKPSVIGESAEPKAEEARLNATVNPSNEKTECHFQYGTGNVSEHTVQCEQGNELEGGEQGVAVTVTGLKQNTTYHYRVVVKNAMGEVKGTGIAAEEEFLTAIRPETPTDLKAEAITTTTATLHGMLNPKAAGNSGPYEFLYRQSAKECEGDEASDGSALGHTPEPVEAKVENLLPNTAYTFCLRTHNEVGEEATSAPVTFTTLVAPLRIESESSTVVSATEARLEAEINTGNSQTTYHFEYGPSAGAYDVSVPAIPAHTSPSLTVTSVSAAAIGLTPGTTYHYRVVASNALPGQVDGLDQEFTTPAAQGLGSPQNCPNEQRRAEQPFGLTLPDCRAYEMVSPVETGGQDATEAGKAAFARASVEGAPAQPTSTPTPEDAGGAITYMAAGTFANPIGAVTENQYLSRRDPQHDRWTTQAITPLHEPDGAEAGGSYPAMVFTPNLTEGITETNAPLTNEAPITETSQGSREIGLYVADFAGNGYRYVGEAKGGNNPVWASTDLSHVVFRNEEWFDGASTPVGVTNTGVELPISVAGWHAVSSDGSRVYFTSEGALYLRVNAEQPQPMSDEQCTVSTDACTIEVAPAPARYWGASDNGEKVFYTANEDLYEYNLPIGQVTGGETTAITTGGEVQGVVQISDSGSDVYFVAKRVLTGEEENQRHEKAKSEADNLYLSAGGHITFITTLGAGDSGDWLDKGGSPNSNTAVVNPVGSALAFLSEESLTDYDNEQAAEGDCKGKVGINNKGETGKCREVYLYDAETNSLACASCNPTGARPIGPANFGQTGEPNLSYRPQNLAEDGALFFNSYDALVPHSNDGRQNVYEYEDGHVYPISNVSGGFESFFLDSSPSGGDVYFASADQLLPEDTGNNVVVYDARVGGGFPVTVAASPCATAEACRVASPPAPAVYGAPASATFSGPGNAAPPPPAVVKPKPTKKTVKCKRGFVKSKKNKCIRKKSKKRAKKSSKSKRGGKS
jgi:hypothetical protein